jgi:4a-hydroxytetrahydrobiopterin dehydratase
MKAIAMRINFHPLFRIFSSVSLGTLVILGLGSPAVARTPDWNPPDLKVDLKADLKVAERLSESEIAEKLQALPTWTTDGQTLSCTYQFPNFVAAIAFVNQLVAPSEAAQHHPDLAIAYGRVTISLTTHDAGGLTNLDFDLARTISDLTSTEDPMRCQPTQGE